MPRKTKKPEDGQAIPEMVEDLSREEARRMCKGGKLAAHERAMAKIWERPLPSGEGMERLKGEKGTAGTQGTQQGWQGRPGLAGSAFGRGCFSRLFPRCLSGGNLSAKRV